VNVIRVTSGPKHHFFGFHDLEISSKKSGYLLSLAVDRIDRPPRATDEVEVCVHRSLEDGVGEVAFKTRAYNFPQGARQQWIGDADVFLANFVTDDGTPQTMIYDVDGCAICDIFKFSTYCVDRAGLRSFTIDFGRLHRLGGYGHSGARELTPDDAAPSSNGIFINDLRDGRSELLIGIQEIAELSRLNTSTSFHHYLTHLRLSPSGRRIAFLHRYRFADGGENTRLVTIGADGRGMRVLAGGFLSHFDWIDDERLIIWGRKDSALTAVRRSGLLQNPLARAAISTIKAPVRSVLRRSGAISEGYLVVVDREEPEIAALARNQLEADGHPMVNPRDRRWMVCDTYPDQEGYRDLFLFRFDTYQRVEIGRFRMIDDLPKNEVITETAELVRTTITVQFSPVQYAFTRSGLHCDLHPRWFSDGRWVAFDSIHEGDRQLYCVDVSSIVRADGSAK